MVPVLYFQKNLDKIVKQYAKVQEVDAKFDKAISLYIAAVILGAAVVTILALLHGTGVIDLGALF